MISAYSRRATSEALVALILVASTLLSTSCSNSSTGGGATPPAGAGSPAGVKMPVSATAAAIVARAQRIETAPSRAGAIRMPKGRQRTAARAMLVASSAEARIVGSTIQTNMAAHTAATIDVAFPTRAQQSRVLKLASGASISLALRDATDAPAEYANGYLVYHGGTRAGAHVIVRPSKNGFEDYFLFDSKPDKSRVEYDLAISSVVAGLRLSSNILELVGADGVPLMHASPPFLVDSAGKRTGAKISITGCAFDDSPQPTWKRKPTAPGATSCRVSVAWDDTNVQYPALLDPTWETAAAMPVNTGFSNREVLAGHTPQQLVVFGFSDNTGPLTTTLFFDVDSATWSVGPPTLVGRIEATSVSFNNDRTNAGAHVFVSGGYTLGSEGQYALQSSTEILALNASGEWAWKSATPMQAARSFHTATVIPTATGSHILLAGGIGVGPYATGCDVGATSGTAELYDTGTDSFVTPPPPNLPAHVWGATAALSADRQAVIILSGANGEIDASSRLCSGSSQVFAFRDGHWLTPPSMPIYAIGPRVVQLSDGRFLTTAGAAYTDATQQVCQDNRNTQIFTYASTAPYGSWTTADPVPGSGGDGTLLTLSNGSVLFGPIATGGTCNSPPSPTTQVELFDPQTGHWSRTTDTAEPHYGGGVASVVKSTGEHQTVVFGGNSAFDATTGWINTPTTEILTLTPNGQSCSVGAECATGICVGSLCQPPGFVVTIDATALSNKGVSIPGVLNGAAIDTTQPRQLSLAAGTYNVQTVAGVASVATFTVKADGTIYYDPALEGVLTGSGGKTLKVNGRAITVDATHLSRSQVQLVVYHFNQGAEVDRLGIATRPAQTVTLLPVVGYGYQFAADSELNSLTFGLDVTGNVHIPPADLWLASGDGTHTLTINGTKVSVTVPAGLGTATLDNVPLPEGQTTDVFVLPAPGTPMTLKLGTQTATITVDEFGNVLGNPTLLTILDIHGVGPSACTTQNSHGAENGWNATPLVCGGASVEDADGIEAATPAVTPLSRLGGRGRFPNELPRFRKIAGGDPVLGDGEFAIRRTDLAFGGTGIHYEFSRTYRSGLDLESPLGSGWDHNYDQRIFGSVVFDPYNDAQLPFAGDVIAPSCDKTVQLQDGAGDVVLFQPKSWFYVVPPSTIYYPGTTTEYVGPYQHFANQTNELTLDYFPSITGGSNQSFWILRRNDGALATVFDSAGFLYSITNATGNSITFQWERAAAAPFPDCTDRTKQECQLDRARWRNKLTRTPVGQQRRLASATDPYRRIYYRYSTTSIWPSSPLTCITAVSSDTDCSYPLVSFLWSGGRFVGVTHGDATTPTIESYRYHAATADAKCMASADIPKYCARLCASPTADCQGGNYESQVLNRCPSLTCAPLTQDQTCVASHRIYKGNNTPGPALCCSDEPSTDTSLCESYMFGGPNCHDGCEYSNQCTQQRDNTNYAVYAAGSGKELNNDIIDVFDGKGALVVHNDYGEDISKVSFDKVVTQTLTSSSTDNVIKFEYHDLVVEQKNGVGDVYIDPAGSGIVPSSIPYSTPDARLRKYQLQDGVAISLCPRVCPNGAPNCAVYDYGAPISSEPQPHPFDMTMATVIHDLHGITRVQYLDQYTDIIREVVLESNEVTDYNYINPNGTGPGLLAGIRDATGVRTCLERDAQGRVVQSSKIAAPGFAGSTPTQATQYGYDFVGQLTDVVNDALVAPSRTRYVRDALERVQTIDVDVGGGKPKQHTIFAYDGEPPPVVRLVALELPTSITYPNGRVDTYSKFDLSGAGPQVTVIDAKAAERGGVPEQRYAQYDTLGRVREEGEVGRFAKHYYYDGNDMFALSGYAHRSDANSPWITTTITSHVVDGQTILDSIVEPMRTTTFTTVGSYVTQKTLKATVAPAGTTLPSPQTSCESHAPDGRLEATILPEGNGVLYTYPAPDPNGQTVRMQRGFGVPTTAAWAQGCTGHPAPSGDPRLSVPYGTHYRAGGFVDTIVDEELRTRKQTSDGFGRVIQIESVKNAKHPDAVAVQRFGYDSKGNRSWEATYKPGTTLASNPYRTPDPKDPALLSYAASEYDLLGRVTKKHTYVLETGDDLVQTWDRDDQAGLMFTADRTSYETFEYDYRGRLLEEVRPDQSTRSMVHGLGVDTITTQTNQGAGAAITRTYNYDTRGRLLNVRDNRGAANPLYVATYDDDGNKLTELKRGLAQLAWKYDSFGRLVEEDRPRNGATVPTTYEFDRNNRMTATVDAEKHRWEMTFTGTDAPLTVTDPLKRVGTYTYIAGWPTSLAATKREPNGRITSFTYDSEARTLDLFSGDCGVNRDPWTCSVSTLMSQRHTIYDQRGLVKEIDGGPANPTPVMYAYDSLGRVLTETVGTETVISHPFTDLGFTQKTQITHGAWSATMKHKYDTSNRPQTVEVAGQAQPVVATYDFGHGAGGPLSVAYANGATAKFVYDDMLRQTGIDVGFTPADATTPTPIASLHQAYGPDSIPRLRQFQFGTDAPLTSVFEVDSDGRLAAENLNLEGITLPAGEIDNSGVDPYIQKRGPTWRQYTLDNIDNIKQRTTIQSSKLLNTVFAMDALSRVTSVGGKTVTHDATDNIDVKGTQDPVLFAFDAFTGYVSSAKSATGTTTFHYDALGRRLRASPGLRAADVVYIWDGNKLVGHGPESALVLDVPGDDPDAHLVSIDQFGAGTSRRFYHQAPDESVIAVSDSDGFVEGYSYSAFGEASIWTKVGHQQTDNIFRYQGQVFDASTGTYSMRARQYRPDWGRFVSPDPLSTMGGASLYAFTGSRPLHYRDSTGMLPTTGGGVSEAWLRSWMASWDTPFGTPPWDGGFGGGGIGFAERFRFGDGMGDMATLYYGPELFGPEHPGVNDALIAKKIGGFLGPAMKRTTDADGLPIGLNDPSGITNEELLFSAHAPPVDLGLVSAIGLARNDRVTCNKGGCYHYDADGPIFTPEYLAILGVGVGMFVGPLVLELTVADVGMATGIAGPMAPLAPHIVEGLEDLTPEVEELVTVSRWGSPGLNPGDWVMKGPVSLWNYFWSGKWQPGFGNQFAPYGSGEEFDVPRNALTGPNESALVNWLKALLGQRRYTP